ncbi:hypothetical protein BCh11DRAFT_00343 [Burkholderia sp. Ch1-1]|nr:hypothetical protein BCh11DRAFT_00343 [Burkholderia sp. Ch1-1]
MFRTPLPMVRATGQVVKLLYWKITLNLDVMRTHKRFMQFE